MARRALTDNQKAEWLGKYDTFIRRAMRDCAQKKPSDDNHYAPGHMWMNDGVSPAAAARKYFSQTRYGRMSCVKLPGNGGGLLRDLMRRR